MRLDMTRGARIASAVLLLLVLVVGAGNLAATYVQVGSVRQAAQKAAAAAAKASAAAQKAAAADAAQVALCRSANQARADQVGLWEYVIHLSKPPATAQGRAVVAGFEHHLHVVFAPRNCALPRPGG